MILNRKDLRHKIVIRQGQGVRPAQPLGGYCLRRLLYRRQYLLIQEIDRFACI